MNGKGDKQRPASVSKAQFNKNFDAIFGKKKPVKTATNSQDSAKSSLAAQ